MSTTLTFDDCRAVLIVLETEDFALTNGGPDVPNESVELETWNFIMVLPDDVEILTSNSKSGLAYETASSTRRLHMLMCSAGIRALGAAHSRVELYRADQRCCVDRCLFLITADRLLPSRVCR